MTSHLTADSLPPGPLKTRYLFDASALLKYWRFRIDPALRPFVLTTASARDAAFREYVDTCSYPVTHEEALFNHMTWDLPIYGLPAQDHEVLESAVNALPEGAVVPLENLEVYASAQSHHLVVVTGSSVMCTALSPRRVILV